MEQIKERVINVLIETREEVKQFIDSETLITDGLLDSLDIMNLIMKLESEFDVEIDPEDVLSDNFESVDKIVALIEKSR